MGLSMENIFYPDRIKPADEVIFSQKTEDIIYLNLYLTTS